MGGVPSIPRDSSRKLEVIGAGFSRTGTVSMQLALEKLLDGAVMHGGTHILSREDAFAKKWVQAYAAKRRGDAHETRKLLSELMAGYVGCTDVPTIHFIPELLDIYPDAKVVLVERDPDAWVRSIKPIGQATSLWWLKYVMCPVPGWRWFHTLILDFGDGTNVALGRDPGNDGGLTREILLGWNDMVKRIVPKEKLLVMELKEGWGPLCKFLDRPIPDEPLPRANDANAADQAAKAIFRRLLMIWVGIGSGSGLILFLGWKLWAGR